LTEIERAAATVSIRVKFEAAQNVSKEMPPPDDGRRSAARHGTALEDTGTAQRDTLPRRRTTSLAVTSGGG
jgi:hypothetical protein